MPDYTICGRHVAPGTSQIRILAATQESSSIFAPEQALLLILARGQGLSAIVAGGKAFRRILAVEQESWTFWGFTQAIVVVISVLGSHAGRSSAAA